MGAYLRKKEDSKNQENCDFCKASETDQCLKKTEYFYILSNRYPYQDNHIMLLPKRHINSELEFTAEEEKALFEIHKSIIKAFYKEFGMCFYFARENTPDQSMWHWHRHYMPTDAVLKHGINRVEFRGITLNL